MLIFAYRGAVDYKIGIIFGVTVFLGSVVGGHITLRLSAVWLRRIFVLGRRRTRSKDVLRIPATLIPESLGGGDP
jgi:hypothetical protein